MRPYFILPLLFLYASGTGASVKYTSLTNSDTLQKATGDTIELSKEIKFNKEAVPKFSKDSSVLEKPQTMLPMGSRPPDQPTLPGPGEPPITDPGGPVPNPDLPTVPELPDDPGDVPANDAGKTTSSLDVSATGGASYSVPLTLPPGLGNAVPQFALTYNSQSGNGIAGYGWSISGLSTISRIPATLFHDNNISGINFDQNDRFALDGQRLMLKSGTYGGNGSEYQTEIYSNLKIISRGVSPFGSNYGPEYFEVLYPDGSKALYGASTDSRTPFEYAIKYSESPLGARISYSYIQSNNILLISQVSYGSTGTTAGINKVSFSYTGAARAEQAWSAGVSFYRNQLLQKISVTAQGTPYRNYKLTYNTVPSLNYQRLISIQEFNGAEDHSFPAVQFGYNSTGEVITSQTISNLSLSAIASNNSQVLTSDFTGNGSMDFILYPTAKNKIWAFYDLEPGSPYMQLGYEVNIGTFRDIFPATWLNSNNKILSGQGIVFVKPAGSGYKFEVFSSGTVSPVYFQYDRTWTTTPTTFTYYSECFQKNMGGAPLPLKFLSGDFNGDGLTDVIAVNQATVAIAGDYIQPYNGVAASSTATAMRPPPPPPPQGQCIQGYQTIPSSAYFINLDRRITSDYVSHTGNFASDYSSGDKLETGDFNGDGKTDILHIKGSSMYVYSLTQNKTLALIWSTNDGEIQPSRLTLFGDYNGDGKTDVMFSTGYNNHFITFTSTGKAFVKHDHYLPFSNTEGTWDGTPGVETLKLYYLISNDIDGDGKTDIIASQTTTRNNDSYGTINVSVYHNTGTSFSSQPTFGAAVSSSKYTNLNHYPIPIFLNPDRLNQKLEFGFMSDNSISLFKFGKDQRTEAELSYTWNDGVAHSITYKPLLSGSSNDDITLYQEGYNQIYPYVDLTNAAALSVVSKITRYSAAPTVSQVFGYGEGVTHMTGLGFLGFGRVIRSNWHTGSGDANRLFSISIHDPQLRGANTKSFTTKSTYISSTILGTSLSSPPPASGIADGASSYDYISRSDVAYSTQLLPNKVFINIPTATASKDMLTGTFATQSFEYDGYYNRTKTVGNFSGAGTKTEEFTYANSPGSTYYIGRLLTSQTTVTNGTSTFSNREEYTYTGWLPTQIKKKGYNTAFTTEDLLYDGFGNVTQRTITVPEGTQRTVKMEYDATGRYPTKITDPDGMVNQMAYNTATGTLAIQTNPYGQVKQNTYDTWGRLISQTSYVGAVTTAMSYQRDASTNTVITQSDSEGRSSISISNSLGQTIETRVKDLSGQYIGKSFQYDAYGRKTGESEPAQPGSYNQWNYTEYDEYDRVKKQTSFTGRVTSFSYAGLSTTVNDGNKSVTTTSNALGHTVSVQDPGGTINYTYFANGDLKTADYGGISQTIEQDGWGRQTKLTDPSAGQYQYEYDGFGQLTKETSPKGVTNYTYDANGKLTQKKITGDNTNIQLDYTYDATTKLLTASSMVNSDGNNASYSYTYDQQKRLSTITEENLHARFVTGYTYNSNNRVATESHEAKNKLNNITVTKAIEMQYQNGELLQTSLQGSGQVLWKVNSLDNKGRISTALQGSSLKTTFLYDQYGLPQQRTVERVSGSPATLLALGYSFDSQRGLLNSRSNSAFSWSESFSYDNLDRLTAFNDNEGNKTQAYDNRGRIESSSQLGSYSYQSNSYRQSELSLNATANTWYQEHSLQQISYNAFKSPVTIHEQGSERISFQYNAALARSHMYYGGEQEDKMQRRFRRHYSEDGSVEITDDLQAGTTSFVFYLGGDAYSAPAIWKQVHTGSQTTQNLYYLHRDHLGSIVLITNEQGNAVEKRQFDAWGNIVKLTDGGGNNLAAFVILDRGYTGHEHLLKVGLIHMNGRLYDPKLHRFLSPDNFVQDPFNTQNFNRFGYVLNNPLAYVDESGEVFWLVPALIFVAKAAAVGAAISAVSYTASVAFSNGGFNNWNWGQFGKSVGIGAVSGIATAGIGSAFGQVGRFGHELLRASAHGLANGAISELSGGDFVSGFAAGGLGSLAGSGFQSWGGDFAQSGVGTISFSALSGGAGAELSGGDFWRGAATGATVGLLNHMADRFESIKASALALKDDATVEQILDGLTNKLKVGDDISGKELSTIRPELKRASMAVKSITRTSAGFNVKMTFAGKLALSVAKISFTGSVNVKTLYNGRDKIYNLNSPGSTVPYAGRTIPLNVYINNNKFTPYRDFHKYINVW